MNIPIGFKYINQSGWDYGIINKITNDVDIRGHVESVDIWSDYAHVVLVTHNPNEAYVIAEKVRKLHYICNVSNVKNYVNINLNVSALNYVEMTRYLAGKKVWVEHTSMTPCYPINFATARSSKINRVTRSH